ncbi:chorismate mutase [Aquabacter cavernae]|uniref:chorismate mutase n=1 Tax=Aquabacter cavernae TaxID=2496029 RepID=UPI000F8CBA8F|nr:chorismate mutase [Aquabacter cavernae]
MSEAPQALADLRREIDALDAEMVGLLARRLDVVHRVLAVKQEHGIPALLPDRVEDVVERVKTAAATQDIPQDLVETLWRCLIGWTVTYEEKRLG